MFGLPEGTDLSFLVNAELEQVCIDTIQVIFKCDHRISINVQSAFAIRRGGEVQEFEQSRDAAAAVVSLLSHSIIRETHSADGWLELDFDNGSSLILRDRDAHYESYQIWHADQIIVV
jgi:hypothetical protein